MNNNNRLYILFSDYTVGYLGNACDCEMCKERGQVEVNILNLDSSYRGVISYDNDAGSLFESHDILTVKNSINELFSWVKVFVIDKQNNEIQFIQEVNKLLNDKIVKGDSNATNL